MSHINSSNFIGQPLNENNNSSSPSSSSSQPHPLNGRHISAILDSHHLHTLMEKVASQEVPVLNQDVDISFVSQHELIKDLSHSHLSHEILLDFNTIFHDFGFEMNSHLEKDLEAAFEEHSTQLQDELTASLPDTQKIEQEVKNLSDRVINQIFGKGTLAKRNADGSLTPATEEEIDRLKAKLSAAMTYRIYVKLASSFQIKLHLEKEKDLEDHAPSTSSTKMEATYTVTVIQQQVLGKQFNIHLEIPPLGKILIVMLEKAIAENRRQERLEEQKQQQLLEVIDRIKHEIIQREILKKEVTTSEIKIQNRQRSFNRYIKEPEEELVKISQVYGKAGTGETLNGVKIHLRLPGLYKMKPLRAN